MYVMKLGDSDEHIDCPDFGKKYIKISKEGRKKIRKIWNPTTFKADQCRVFITSGCSC